MRLNKGGKRMCKIKVDELRIGNLLSIHGKIVEVDADLLHFISAADEHDYELIKLNYNWLNRADFVMCNDLLYHKSWNGIDWESSYFDDSTKFSKGLQDVFEKEGRYYYILGYCGEDSEYEYIELFSVNQLQNIHFYIRDEELSINIEDITEIYTDGTEVVINSVHKCGCGECKCDK